MVVGVLVENKVRSQISNGAGLLLIRALGEGINACNLCDIEVLSAL